jgi:Na+/melibiose symporter-like transporter
VSLLGTVLVLFELLVVAGLAWALAWSLAYAKRNLSAWEFLMAASGSVAVLLVCGVLASTESRLQATLGWVVAGLTISLAAFGLNLLRVRSVSRLAANLDSRLGDDPEAVARMKRHSFLRTLMRIHRTR